LGYLSSSSASSNYVPYNGANSGVNIGANPFSTNWAHLAGGTSGTGLSYSTFGNTSDFISTFNSDGSLPGVVGWKFTTSGTNELELRYTSGTRFSVYNNSTNVGQLAYVSDLSSYLISSMAALEYVSYNGSLSDVNLGIHNLSTQGSLTIGDNATSIYSDYSNNGVRVFDNTGHTDLFRDGIEWHYFLSNTHLNFIAPSTLSNNQTIQLPANSGTIALTSDIPSLTGYITYTGGTSDINISHDVIANNYFVNSGGTYNIDTHTSLSDGKLALSTELSIQSFDGNFDFYTSGNSVKIYDGANSTFGQLQQQTSGDFYLKTSSNGNFPLISHSDGKFYNYNSGVPQPYALVSDIQSNARLGISAINPISYDNTTGAINLNYSSGITSSGPNLVVDQSSSFSPTMAGIWAFSNNIFANGGINTAASTPLNISIAGTQYAKWFNGTGDLILGGSTDGNYKLDIPASGTTGYFRAGSFFTIASNGTLNSSAASNSFGTSGFLGSTVGVSGGVTTTAAGSTTGRLFAVMAGTITRTTDSGSITGVVAASSIAVPTFGTSSSTNYANAATLYIDGAPVNGANVTITNPYSLYVNSGVSRLSGLRLDLGSDATGDMLYRSGTNSLTRIPIGSTGQILTVAGGLPAWQNGINYLSGRTTVADANYSQSSTDYLIAYTSLTASRTVTLTAISDKQTVIIKDESGNAAANNIIINAPPGKYIDGVSSKTISANMGSFRLYYQASSGNYFTY
jgi:hypothetical protein